MAKVTIVIPSYNQALTIGEAIRSCLRQDYIDKEIIIVDDCSTDRTVQIADIWGIKVYKNKTNLGIGKNLEECVKKAKGKYIVYLCGDDYFTNPKVISDMVEIFESQKDIVVIDRWYYQFIDGFPGAVTEVREKNTLISSVNPSGMGFRKDAIVGFSNKIYVELPTMIDAMLRWQGNVARLEYDTVAVRLHKNNTSKKKWYYKGSLIQNWYDLLGNSRVLWDFKANYILLKNRAGLKGLIIEIGINLKLEPRILLHPGFYFYALLTILTPRIILTNLCDWYRHRIRRRFCRIIERGER